MKLGAVRSWFGNRRRRDVVVGTLAFASAVAAFPLVRHLQPQDLARSVANAPMQLAELPASTLEESREGKHLGFDTSVYPGDDAMKTWKDDSPYEWVGYYLAAPCHKDTTWSGKRTTLADMGWGVAVVYVGQQTWGHDPAKPVRVTHYVTRYVKKRVRRNGHYRTIRVKKTVAVHSYEKPRAAPGQTCASQFVSEARGIAEAKDAIQRTAAEGFAPGTVIFLDIEHMDVVPQRMRDYYQAWVRQVLADGRYRPGIYTHTANAALIHRDVKGVYAAFGATAEPPFWIAGGSDFSPEKAPAEVGHYFASAWQGVLDKVETRSGVELPIDVNVASVKSPSTTGIVAEAFGE